MEPHKNLTCPITCDWLVDPITTPCCGDAISRSSLVDWYQINKTCPMCRSDINNFNPQLAPSSKTIIAMIEEAQKLEYIKPKVEINIEKPPTIQQKSIISSQLNAPNSEYDVIITFRHSQFRDLENLIENTGRHHTMTITCTQLSIYFSVTSETTKSDLVYYTKHGINVEYFSDKKEVTINFPKNLLNFTFKNMSRSSTFKLYIRQDKEFTIKHISLNNVTTVHSVVLKLDEFYTG